VSRVQDTAAPAQDQSGDRLGRAWRQRRDECPRGARMAGPAGQVL